MDKEQASVVGVVDAEIDQDRRENEARLRERYWRAAERIGERNRDKDPDEELVFITQVVEEVRQEQYERERGGAQGGR